jgi:uncharacterized SAM-binding protein YcdF (DUF218 family)
MFLFKKVVAYFLMPLSICLELFLIGLFLLWFTKKQKFGRAVLTLGVLFFFIIGFGQPFGHLLKSLERQYPPFLVHNETNLQNLKKSVKWIVVLGGGKVPDLTLLAIDQLEPQSLIRLVEGIRLHRLFPESKLLVSGGGIFDNISEAELMAKAAQSLGVNKEAIVIESDSRDTKDQAKLIRTMVGHNVFILVTSASHMPRSMAMFKKQGLHPIAAPTDHIIKERVKETSPIHFLHILPTSYDAQVVEQVFYEYLGILWAKLRGQI